MNANKWPLYDPDKRFYTPRITLRSNRKITQEFEHLRMMLQSRDQYRRSVLERIKDWFKSKNQ